jgi:glucokinase
MANIGIEIGGTKLQLCAGDAAGRILERVKSEVELSRGAEGIQKAIERDLPALVAKYNAAAIGVGFGGPVDWRTGKVFTSHQVTGWSGFNLKGWLAGLTGLRVFVDNDANVGALGEAWHGAGKGSNPIFYVTLGSGVGGGLVVDGKIYHGARPGEAEIGHVRLDKSGATVESRCSGWAVDAKVRTSNAEHPDSILARLTAGAGRGEARFLAKAIAQNDPYALKLIEEVADDLAFALSHVSHLFHPEMIVLGGGLSNCGEVLRAAVGRHLTGYLMEVFRPGPDLILATLKEDAVPLGALCLCAG